MNAAARTVTPAGPDLSKLRLLTAAQVAELWGINRSTVWRLTQRVHNPLPVLRLSARCTRFSATDLAAWLAEEKT